MVLMTMIARVADGLPLSASVQDDQQQLGVGNTEYQNQAKMLFKKLNNQSFSRSTIETGPYNFQVGQQSQQPVPSVTEVQEGCKISAFALNLRQK
uniref:Putative vesicle transport protein sec22 n=1 Tax=Rhipicephalus microplus TaxID=6941 RepID=A0A6G4ZZQ6_RHIMP